MLRLAVAAMVALSAVASPAVASAPAGRVADDAYGALGANFNENIDDLDYGELQEARAGWVRGFFPMPAVNQGDPAQHVAIRTLNEASGRGYRTILSLKFPYNKASFPAPGSAKLAAELARLDKVLPTVMGKADILVIGNEPFIESLPAERDQRLNTFYETVARHVIDYRRERCGADCRTTLYMGALNRLDLPDRRTPAAERWMTFVRQTPEIEGVDIHPHVPTVESTQLFLDYILARMRTDQTFLATEFSLVHHWKKHLKDPVAATFAQKYGFAPGTQVWQVIKAAADEPFSQAKWNDFLASSPWFTSRSGFLGNQMRMFRGTGRLAVATYGFKQDDAMVKDFGPTKDPWLLNSVYASHTVKPRPSGLSAPSPWLKSFQALQPSTR
ncbi:hypothetical protein ACFOY2_21815 [Nonomuraea purpurea]|uniref:Uncharacterized protein n=1 Tax=Nonomuraea purpurea TaxID=1849276 RepID=A0ABV8GC42_9ACTN